MHEQKERRTINLPDRRNIRDLSVDTLENSVGGWFRYGDQGDAERVIFFRHIQKGMVVGIHTLRRGEDSYTVNGYQFWHENGNVMYAEKRGHLEFPKDHALYKNLDKIFTDADSLEKHNLKGGDYNGRML